MEKTKLNKAVALEYDTESMLGAPKVLAKGSGSIADTIVAKAKEFDVPLFANEELANSLMNVDIDREIPPELYKAVADVFLWLMKSEKEK